ncbi:MAG: hypothetical protein LUI08_03680 [Prevotella sp.]|nr:hypothetical protein [Prevotella sp.]
MKKTESDNKQIKNDAGRHVATCMCVYVALLCVVRCVMTLLKMGYGISIAVPLIVALLFAVVETVAVTMLWLRTATLHPDRLTNFHTAVTAGRMLGALVVMFVAYLFVGRDGMLPYIGWLLLYYFAALILHSVFFSRENKKLYSDKN